MGHTWKIVARPPFEQMVASFLSPDDQKVSVRFTCHSKDRIIPVGATFAGRPGLWSANLQVFSLGKSTNPVRTELKTIWFSGWMRFRSSSLLVIGTLSPHDSQSWIAGLDFDYEATSIGVDVLNDASSAMEMLTGNDAFGPLIAAHILGETPLVIDL